MREDLYWGVTRALGIFFADSQTRRKLFFLLAERIFVEETLKTAQENYLLSLAYQQKIEQPAIFSTR